MWRGFQPSFKYGGGGPLLRQGQLDYCSQFFTPSLGHGTLKCLSAEKMGLLPSPYWL